MSTKTAQVVFLMLAGTFCVIVLGIVATLIASIFHFGDGEAQKIISDMTPVALGSIGALALVFTGHTVSSLKTMQMANSTIASGAASLIGGLVAQTVQTPTPVAPTTPAPASAATGVPSNA